MSRHATAEELSAYLDDELEPVRLRLVKSHLEECEECRAKVEGLRGLVGELRRLETFRPPPALGQHIQRRIALEPRPRGWVEGVENRLKGMALQPNLGFTFALVFALAVILYLFADWTERGVRRDVQILRPPVSSSDSLQGPSASNTTFRQIDGLWVEQGVTDAPDLPEVPEPSDLGQEIRRSLPGVEELLREGPVVLRWDDRVVRLIPGPSAATSPTP